MLWCRLGTNGGFCECSNWLSRVFKMLEISSVTDEIFDTDKLCVLCIFPNSIHIIIQAFKRHKNGEYEYVNCF
jgi:hypothetical protein